MGQCNVCTEDLHHHLRLSPTFLLLPALSCIPGPVQARQKALFTYYVPRVKQDSVPSPKSKYFSLSVQAQKNRSVGRASMGQPESIWGPENSIGQTLPCWGSPTASSELQVQGQAAAASAVLVCQGYATALLAAAPQGTSWLSNTCPVFAPLSSPGGKCGQEGLCLGRARCLL